MRATSVFPTPVGPRKRNEPTGLLGFFKRTRTPYRTGKRRYRRTLRISVCACRFRYSKACRFFCFTDETNSGPAGDDLIDIVLCYSTAKNESSIERSSYEIPDPRRRCAFPISNRFRPRRFVRMFLLVASLARAPASSKHLRLVARTGRNIRED